MDFVTFLSQLYGKGDETAQKLRAAGCVTPDEFRNITPDRLLRITGLSLSSCKGMIETAKGMVQRPEREAKRELTDIKGVGTQRAKKLRRAGLRTTKAVATAKEEKLANLLKVPKSTASRIRKSARRMEEPIPSRAVTPEETEVLISQVVPQERPKAGKKEDSKKSEESFWRFG